MSIKIAFDMDNTIFNFMEVLIKEYNKKYSDNVQFSDLTKYDFSDKIKIPLKQFFKEFATSENFRKMKPYPYVKEFIDLIHNGENIKVYFVSAGHPKTMVARDKLLSKTFSWYESKQLIMLRDKHLLLIDVLFDDCLDNFNGAQYDCIVVTQPWNKDIGGYECVDNWEDWYKELKNMIDEKEKL